MDIMSVIRGSPSKLRTCDYGLPMARLTSWTRENPGRKFKACKLYDPKTENRGCKCFEWIDDEDGTGRQRDVINQLLLDKKLMRGEINSLQREVEDLTGQIRCLISENDNLKTKCKALSGDRKRYKREGEDINCIGRVGVVFVICVVVVIVGIFVMFTKF